MQAKLVERSTCERWWEECAAVLPVESHVDESLHARVFKHFLLGGFGLKDHIEGEESVCGGDVVVHLASSTRSVLHNVSHQAYLDLASRRKGDGSGQLWLGRIAARSVSRRAKLGRN